MNAIFVDTTSAADDLTGKSCQANYFRVGHNDSAFVNSLRSLLKENPAKTWDLYMADYALGHD
jgi:ABC-type branched-subunit amino acid transport system substrate-binding protein